MKLKYILGTCILFIGASLAALKWNRKQKIDDTIEVTESLANRSNRTIDTQKLCEDVSTLSTAQISTLNDYLKVPNHPDPDEDSFRVMANKVKEQKVMYDFTNWRNYQGVMFGT